MLSPVELVDESMHQARIAEQEIRDAGCRGPLHGIPIGIKDMYGTAKTSTTAAFIPGQLLRPCAQPAEFCGVDERGLPLGLQIVGKPWDEEGVLRLAHRYLLDRPIPYGMDRLLRELTPKGERHVTGRKRIGGER